jgi:hypothetical protein
MPLVPPTATRVSYFVSELAGRDRPKTATKPEPSDFRLAFDVCTVLRLTIFICMMKIRMSDGDVYKRQFEMRGQCLPKALKSRHEKTPGPGWLRKTESETAEQYEEHLSAMNVYLKHRIRKKVQDI